MKNLKLLITILVMLALSLIIVLVVLNFKKTKIENQTMQIENEITNNVEPVIDAEAPQLTFNTSLQQITSKSMLYSISKNIDKYFQYIKSGNLQAVDELGGNNNYIISNNVKYNIKQAYSTANEYLTKYYTYGIITIANGNYTATEQEAYIIVYLTSDNKGYKLQTITEEEFLAMEEVTRK